MQSQGRALSTPRAPSPAAVTSSCSGSVSPAPASLPVRVHCERERAGTPGERWEGEKGIHGVSSRRKPVTDFLLVSRQEGEARVLLGSLVLCCCSSRGTRSSPRASVALSAAANRCPSGSSGPAGLLPAHLGRAIAVLNLFSPLCTHFCARLCVGGQRTLG